MANATGTSRPPAGRIEAYDRLVATVPGVERKGATLPYTSINGHMFSFLTETGSLALRLPTAEREAFILRYGATLQSAHGTVMKEYVSVPDATFDDTAELAPWFLASHAHAAGLKPKATARKT